MSSKASEDRSKAVTAAAHEGVDSAAPVTAETNRKLKFARLFKFRDEKDLQARFPFKTELKDEGEGVYSFEGYMLVTQDLVFKVLEAEFEGLPKSLGCHKLHGIMKGKYIGISFSQVKRFLEINEDHQRWRQRHRSQRITPVVPTGPGMIMQVDLTDLKKGGVDLGGTLKDERLTQRALVMVDCFTKMIYGTLIRGKTADKVVGAIEAIIEGLPFKVGVLKCDNGKEFASAPLKELAERKDFKILYGVAHNPLGQGQVELSNRIVKTYLYSNLEGRGGGYVATAFKKALWTANHSVNSAHGFRPADLAVADLPASVRSDVRSRLRANASGADPSAKYNFPLKAGDKVRVDILCLGDNFKLAAQKKSHQFKASHQATYSKEVYEVEWHHRDNFVKLKDFYRLVTRGDVVKVVEPEGGDGDRHVREWQDDEALQQWTDKRQAHTARNAPTAAVGSR